MKFHALSLQLITTRNFTIAMYALTLSTALCLSMKDKQCSSCVCTFNEHSVIADCRHRHLIAIPDDLPSNVTTLLLAHNDVSNLSSAFSRFHRLRHLDLSYNHLRQLETNVFASFISLQSLNLEGNDLQLNSRGYPEGVFHGLRHLRFLKLNNNCMSSSGMSYPNHQLAELSALEVLHINGLPEARFGPELRSLKHLTNLTMSGRIGTCNIFNITADYFTNLQTLKHLNMTNCDLKHININAFSSLISIRTIDISSNEDLGFDNVINMFHGLQNSSVEALYINAIVRSSDTCVTIPKEIGLYLERTPLKEIYANDNYIVAAESGAMKSLPKTLEVLSIRNSRLVYGLYFIDLLDLKHLRILDLSEQRVGNVMPDFGQAENFFKFPLPPNLEEFYSEDSTFRVGFINVNFSTNRLKKISYRKNVITEWKGPMYGLDHLEELDLSENFCDRAVDGWMKGFFNLRIFRANGNYLGSFLKNDTSGKVFGDSNRLTFLDLSLNKIDVLPFNIFGCQGNLETINLSRNSISDIKFKVTHMNNLTFLNIMGNQITSLSREFTSQLDTVRTHSDLKVDLSDNPILCSCTTLWFIQWMTERKTMFTNQKSYLCSPQSDFMSGNNVFDIMVDLRAHCTSHLGLAMGLLATVTSVVCLVLAAIAFRYRWKLRYLYYVARGRYRGHSIVQKEDAREFDYDAFVSYADEDRHFALHTFIEKLEKEGNIRLCLHHRDFIPGEPIAANILSAIQRSRRVVVVLSPNFLDSYWCRWEFEMARMESLYTERNIVVLVKYQEVIPKFVPRDLMYMMHTQTYLEVPQDPNDQETFWTALRLALAEA